MGYLLQFLQLYFRFLQSATIGFTTAVLDGATGTQMGLNNSSMHFVEHIRWKLFHSILNTSKGKISLGLDSVDMFVPS